MGEHDDLIGLERAAWDALATSGEAAVAFYRDVLTDDVVMLVPGGMVITGREAALEAMGGPPWDAYDVTDEQVIELGDAAGVVAYQATARRADVQYRALFTSTYVRHGDRWRLAVHQQTPF